MKSFFLIFIFCLLVFQPDFILAQASAPAGQESLTLWIIAPEICRTCKIQPVVNSLKALFAKVVIQSLKPDDPLAQELIKKHKITMLPAYIFSKSLAKEANFSQFQNALIPAQDSYYVNPSMTGVSYFLGREVIPGKLDLLIFITRAETLPLVKMVEGIIPQKRHNRSFILNLIGQIEENQEAKSGLGKHELQEGELYACMENLYPEKFWDYLLCRLADSDNLFWEDCLTDKSIKKEKVVQCARTDQGKKLYAKRIQLSQELQIQYGPLFVLDNVEIFGVTPQSTLQDIMSAINP